MCGIAGLLVKKASENDKKNVEIMTRSLKHRGPDSEGFFMDKQRGIYLGHTRLRVIDLDRRSDQPMLDKDKSIAMIFNGEIYNYKEIKKKLLEKNYQFSTTSDTEVIVYGYKEYGTKIFEKLDGVFAIGIWDFEKRKLIIARDRLGVKPLYYLDSPSGFYFASEVKAFREVSIKDWKKSLNLEGLKDLMGFQYYFDPDKTLLEGIKKVHPGTYLVIDKNSIKSETFWNLPNTTIEITYEEALKETKNLLYKSIEKRIFNCDVPQGILLSGGLDSSTVAAIASQISGKNSIKTFTAISNSKMDERNYAKKVAGHIGSDHTQVEISHIDILENIDDLVTSYDDINTVDPGFISISLIAKKIKEQGITMTLTGDGADEVFGGYSWYGLSKFPFNVLPHEIRNGLYYYVLSRCISNKYFWYHYKKLDKEVEKYSGSIYSQISQFEYLDQLPNHFNMKVDKCNMAHGVEPRVPYLDFKLVEFVQQLPAEYKLEGKYFNYYQSWEKRLLRDIAKELLPKEIYMRKKHGFLLSMIDTINSNKNLVSDRIKKNSQILNEVLPLNYHEWILKPTKNKILAKEKEFMTWKTFLFSTWFNYYFK